MNVEIINEERWKIRNMKIKQHALEKSTGKVFKILENENGNTEYQNVWDVAKKTV